MSARRTAERRADWLDALAFRRVVEPGAAAQAALRAAGRDLTETERHSLSEALASVADAGAPAAHRQADSRLHLTLATLSGSPLLVRR